VTGPRERSTAGQAPVSFRVTLQVLVHLERTVGRLDEDVRRALAAVTDSPAVVGGRTVAGGGFHALGLAAGMDAVAVALVQAAELAGQRLHRLLDGRFSGLPDQFTSQPGPRSGLVVVHKRAVGALNEARRLAAPASVGLADTSLGQEDAATFAPEAARNSAGSRSWPARSPPASSWPSARPGGCAGPSPRPAWASSPAAWPSWSPRSTRTGRSAPT
jgi:histidine ammonia-lyase